MQAEIAMIIRSGSTLWNAFTTIGIRIPKVPQDVPVANASRHPITKIIAGSRFISPLALPSNQARYEDICAKTVGHGFQRPGKSKNQDGGNHRLEAFRQAGHAIAQAHNTANQIEENRNYKSEETSQRQAEGCVTLRKCGNKIRYRRRTPPV